MKKRIVLFTGILMFIFCFALYPADGLIGYWNFDEGEGGTAADASGNNNTASLNGARWVDGRNKTAVYCDGTDDTIIIPDNDSLDAEDGVTISAWINHNDDNTGMILGKSYAYFLCKLKDGTIQFRYRIAGAKWCPEINSKSTIPSREWVHIAATYSRTEGKVKLYINGKVDTEAPVEKSKINNSKNNLEIGSMSDWGDKYLFAGKIDEVSLYNKALTNSEIMEIAGFDNPAGELNSPAGSWSFNENGGSQALDSSGNKNSAVLNGPEWVKGVYQSALSWDGEDDTVVIQDNQSLDAETGITISAWVNHSDDDTGMIMGKSYAYYLSKRKDDTLQFRYRIAGAKWCPEINSKSTIPAGKWVHVAGTFSKEEGIARIYINGELDTEVSTGMDFINNSDNNLEIGSMSDWGAKYLFKGLIDEPALYTVSLSQDQIKKIMGNYDVAAKENQIPAARPRAVHRIPGEILLDENFDDNNADGWSVMSGRWTGISGMYQGRNTSGRGEVYYPEGWWWSNYTISADVKATGAAAGLAFRAANDFSAYYLYRLTDLNTVEFAKISPSGFESVKTWNYSMNEGKMYTLLAEVHEDSFDLFINDSHIGTMHDADYSAGTVGLYLHKTGTEFNNVYVTGTAERVSSVTAPSEQIEPERITPAFPGAEGFGRWSLGGRGGKVYFVTNLNDSGKGSLRNALNESGARTVLFAVSGTIELHRPLVITSGNVTIAGQTAPGDGICLKNHALEIKADDVIVRYIRIRPGADAEGEDAITVVDCENVIIDHCSTSWSTDETLSVTNYNRFLDNITVQWCFITENLSAGSGHAYGSLIRGAKGSKVSYHHNLYAHHQSRCPMVGNYTSRQEDSTGILFDFRNNVIYNYAYARAGYNDDTDTVSKYNFINNYYKSGPSTPEKHWAFRVSNPYAEAYFDGNYMNGRFYSNQWELIDDMTGGAAKADRPLDVEYVTTVPALKAYKYVIETAGCSLKRDAVDLRIADDVHKGTGSLLSDPSAMGGWPVLESENPPPDTDQDGMPDYWEVKKGLNKRNPADNVLDADGDGYTNLEEYLNSLVPANTFGGSN